MRTQLLSTLEQARNYTLRVAEMMPETLYHFKPTDTVWNFKELMHHIGYGVHWYGDNYLKKQDTPWAPPVPTEDKASTITYLNAAFADLQVNIAHMTEDSGTINGVYAALDHITHHRGQATVYLRCNGIAPPEYIY
jgi:uncharacterized damage-inducible protein DinB